MVCNDLSGAEKRLDEIVKEAHLHGVGRINLYGTIVDGSQRSVELRQLVVKILAIRNDEPEGSPQYQLHYDHSWLGLNREQALRYVKENTKPAYTDAQVIESRRMNKMIKDDWRERWLEGKKPTSQTEYAFRQDNKDIS